MHAQPTLSAERPVATPAGLGMLFFLVSETFLFGALFIIYYYLRAHTYVPAHWPPEGVDLHLALGSLNTVVLLSSSVAMYRAIAAIRQGRSGGSAGWLAATAGLGTLFLAIKLSEWLTNGFGPWDHAYGSIYYMLTGTHALHLLIGLGVLTALWVRARAGCFSAERHLAVEVGGFYWHFVDAVWLAVYATIYLLR